MWTATSRIAKKPQVDRALALSYNTNMMNATENKMKHYFVVYKSFQKPGLEHFEVDAKDKAEAKMKFLEANIKHDYIVRVII